MSLTTTTILGVPIVASAQQEVLAFMQQCLQEPQWHHIVTTNNEMLVVAHTNQEFFDLLQSTSCNIADSTGLLLASRLTSTPIAERSTGVDTLQKLCGSLTKDQPVFFLGAAPGVAKKAATVLQATYPNVCIAGTFAGSPASADAPEILKKINDSKAMLLFVAYGAPGQDIWLNTYKNELPHVRLAMGVGGSFDFIAGNIKRAPRMFRRLGLEWLWRFILQPSRYKRMWQAVVVFPFLVIVKQKR